MLKAREKEAQNRTTSKTTRNSTLDSKPENRDRYGSESYSRPGSANLEAWIFCSNVQLEDENFFAVEEKATGVLFQIRSSSRTAFQAEALKAPSEILR